MASLVSKILLYRVCVNKHLNFVYDTQKTKLGTYTMHIFVPCGDRTCDSQRKSHCARRAFVFAFCQNKNEHNTNCTPSHDWVHSICHQSAAIVMTSHSWHFPRFCNGRHCFMVFHLNIYFYFCVFLFCHRLVDLLFIFSDMATDEWRGLYFCDGEIITSIFLFFSGVFNNNSRIEKADNSFATKCCKV